MTIVTTEPNRLVGRIQNRMPVILADEQLDRWLNHEAVPETKLHECLKPFCEELMEMHAVSMLVNDVRNDMPELILPA